MLLEHGCLDLMCQPQKLLTFWTSEPQVAYKMVAYIKKCTLNNCKRSFFIRNSVAKV